MHTFWLVSFSPVLAFVMFLLPAALISRWVGKKLPEGRLKRILFYKVLKHV